MLSKFLTASLLALQSAALLVVPETNLNAHHGGSHELGLRLQCPECPFPSLSEDSKLVLNDAWDSWLPLNFTTEGNALSVNGHQVFPLENRPVSLETVLHRQSDMKASTPVPVGYGLEFQVVDVPDSDSKLTLFHFTVLDIGGFPVPVSTVYLPTIKSPNGDLTIVTSKAGVLPMPKKSWRQCRRDRRCLKHLILARIRAFVISAKLRALAIAKKVSAKVKGCHRRPHKVDSSQHQRPGHDMMQHGGHHHTHQQHKSKTFAHRFCHILKTVFLPGLIGVVAVTSIAIIAIQLTCGLVAARAFFRRHSNKRVVDQEQGVAPEKEALMTEEQYDLPPHYDESDYGKIVIPAEKE
uniref:DUF7728 domain-containing protein n=1 Tax=Coccidioides posadasii RMSCC 3488 TaxID=454284 RepID=A0A0J6FA92_COCPO|nr:hypothetical protein CPAG_03468 [Coccidioides posadasii RMSCC 3488]